MLCYTLHLCFHGENWWKTHQILFNPHQWKNYEELFKNGTKKNNLKKYIRTNSSSSQYRRTSTSHKLRVCSLKLLWREKQKIKQHRSNVVWIPHLSKSNICSPTSNKKMNRIMKSHAFLRQMRSVISILIKTEIEITFWCVCELRVDFEATPNRGQRTMTAPWNEY